MFKLGYSCGFLFSQDRKSGNKLFLSPEVGSAMAEGRLFVVDESAPSSSMADSTQIRTRMKSRIPFMMILITDQSELFENDSFTCLLYFPTLDWFNNHLKYKWGRCSVHFENLVFFSACFSTYRLNNFSHVTVEDFFVCHKMHFSCPFLLSNLKPINSPEILLFSRNTIKNCKKTKESFFTVFFFSLCCKVHRS